MEPMYKYEDFLQAAKEAGWSEGNGFSKEDWKLARQNADAGMSILNAKKDYYAATTAEGRAAANQRAEQIRSDYGGYTGGPEGNRYYRNPPSPGSFTMSEEKPTFSYNVETDPVYAAYQKQYAREGRRATQEALGNAAAATGGIPSSYAVTAASQAGDYYAAQSADKIPELYQQAYNRYLNELSQYNADRNFLYGQHVDEINFKSAQRQEALQNALYGAQYGDYSKMEALGYDMSNVPAEYQKEYQRQQDEYQRQQDAYQQKYNLAGLAASVGDNSLLTEYFGINPDKNTVNAEMLYNLALAQAQMGNYSYLNQLTGRYY